MHEQDLKSLLENIYHLLAEDDWWRRDPHYSPVIPKPVYGPSYDLPTPPERNPEDMERLYGPDWNNFWPRLNPPRNIKPEQYIDWVISNMHHDNTPFTEEEIERYFTDSVKPKNIHSALLENIIYHLLAEEAPPALPDLPKHDTVIPTIPPDKTAEYQMSYYDRVGGPPPMPTQGPWSPNSAGIGVWQDAFHNFQPYWPPPTSEVPDGPGGMWMVNNNPQCPQCGFQIFYVYPQQPNGQFFAHTYHLQFPGQFGDRITWGGYN